MTEPITVTIKDDVAIVTMDDGKVNAAGFAMVEALRSALRVAQTDARAVILKGRPGVLSGGFDLKIIRGPDANDVNRLVQLGVHALIELFTHPQPVVVAATGHAVALGAFMTLTGDYRIGTAGDFRIGLNETAVGLELAPFAIELVNARLSPRYVTEAAILGQLYSPTKAIEIGFLDEVVASEDIDQIAFQTASELGQLDPKAFAANKRAFRTPTAERILESLN